MNRKPGCVVCEAGELFFYYKNETDGKVRIEAFDCHLCNRGDIRSGQPRPEEKLISAEEFFSLIEHGWSMDDV